MKARGMATLVLLMFLLAGGCVGLPDEEGTTVGGAFVSPVGQPAERLAFRYYAPIALTGKVSKRGVGTAYGSCERVGLLGGSWHYDWGPYPPDCEGSRAIAMMWGRYEAVPEVPPHVGIIAGFNEPDLTEQANLRPEAAVTLWRAIEDRYPGKRLIAPAPSPWGRTWLLHFRNAYIEQYGVAPRFDGGLAAHCYFASAGECIELLRWYIDRAREWGSPGVWLTEFAFLPCVRTTSGVAGVAGIGRALDQARALQVYLEGEEWILGYAWFIDWQRGDEVWAFRPASCDTALVRGGELTAFGEWYAEPVWR